MSGKKILGLLLALIMTVSLLPAQYASAAEGDTNMILVRDPMDRWGRVGETVEFFIGAHSNNLLNFQWQYKTPTGTWKNSTAEGNQTDTLTISVTQTRNGYQYRCIVTDNAGHMVTSDAATLHVEQAITALDLYVKAPVAGQPIWSPTFTDSAGNELDDEELAACTHCEGDSWWSVVGSDQLGSYFEAGRVYRLEFGWNPLTSEHYYFADSVTVTVNGQPAVVEDVEDTIIWVYYDFPVLAPFDYVLDLRSAPITMYGTGVNSEPGILYDTLQGIADRNNLDNTGLNFEVDLNGYSDVFNADIRVTMLSDYSGYVIETVQGSDLDEVITLSNPNMREQYAQMGHLTYNALTVIPASVVSIPAVSFTVAAPNVAESAVDYDNRVDYEPLPGFDTEDYFHEGGEWVHLVPNGTGGYDYDYRFDYFSAGEAYALDFSVMTEEEGLFFDGNTVFTAVMSNGKPCTITTGSLPSDNLWVRVYYTIPGVITEDPETNYFYEGENAWFQVQVDAKDPVYQWQYKIPSGSWKNCSSSTEGYNTNTLQPVATMNRNGYQYRCIVTDATGEEMTSGAATLYVIPHIGSVNINVKEPRMGDSLWEVTFLDNYGNELGPNDAGMYFASLGFSVWGWWEPTDNPQSQQEYFLGGRSYDLMLQIGPADYIFGYLDRTTVVTVNGAPTTFVDESDGYITVSQNYDLPALTCTIDLTNGSVAFYGDDADRVWNTLQGMADQQNGYSMIYAEPYPTNELMYLFDLDRDGNYDISAEVFPEDNNAVVIYQIPGCSILDPVHLSLADSLRLGYIRTGWLFYEEITVIPYAETVPSISFTFTAPVPGPNNGQTAELSWTPGDDWDIEDPECSWFRVVPNPDGPGGLHDYGFENFEAGGTYVVSFSLFSNTGIITADTVITAVATNGVPGRVELWDSGSMVGAYLIYTIPGALEITEQPQDASGPIGSTVEFHVTAEGTGLTYQWQYKTRTGSWKNCSSATQGYNTDTLHVVVTTTRNGYQYQCIVTDSAGTTATSDPATLSIAANPLTITEQPQDASGPIGSTVEFHVVAEGTGLQYQWQYKTRTGSWKNCSSATQGYNTDTLHVVVTTTRNGYQYQCIVTDSAGATATSDPATLSIAANPLTITEQPQDASGPIGSTVEFHVGATGAGLQYQWQYKTRTGSWKNCSSATQGYNTDTLHVVVTTTRNGYQYQCIVTDSAGATATSDPATLSVAANAFAITAHPQDVYAKDGTTVVFTVAATGEGLQYQWQYMIPGGTWKNSTGTGCTTAALEVTAAAKRNNYRYQCIVTDGNGETLTSNEAVLTVFAIKKNPSDASGAVGSTVKFSVTAIGTDLTYQWQYKTPTGTWKNCSSVTQGYNERELTVVVTQGRNNYQYRCIVTDSMGETITSAAAKLTVG